jgi:hypothetical protein
MLVIIGLVFILFPFANYLLLSFLYRIPLNEPVLLFNKLNPLGNFLAFFLIIVGVGLLSITRWGWYLFLFYMPVFILYSLISYFITPDTYYLTVMILSAFGFLAIIFFTRKNISVPYMHIHRRGWRMQKRIPIGLDISVNGTERKTRDFGEKGFFLSWPDCPQQLGAEVDIFFTFNNENFHFVGGIVRVEETGVGIAFRGLAIDDQRRLQALIRGLRKAS